MATVTGVATSDLGGVHTGAVTVQFAGDGNYVACNGVGDLTVSPAATVLKGAAGMAWYGERATLSVTLSSSVTKLIIPGEVVSFSLNGKAVGSAVTNSQGMASLINVPTSLATGTYTGAITVQFAGDSNYASSNGSGALVINPTPTALIKIAATATYGGTATLTANLMSLVGGYPLSGEPVNFLLDGVKVGSAVTDSKGVATLSGVATSDLAGTDANAVAASFAGDTNYLTSNGQGDMVVGQAPTLLGSISGTSSFGGSATLKALLTSSVTSQGIAGELVSFTLDGTAVGTAVTDSNGEATLTGVTTIDGAGTHTGVVTASFAGDANYLSAATASGNLTVDPAALSLVNVSGGAVLGGSATLVAKLTSQVTDQGVAGAGISFSLHGAYAGTAVTGTDGVATLTGVPSTDPLGLDPGAVVASFTGNPNYTIAGDVTGNLLVSRWASSLGNVSGSVVVGGPATLTATFTSNGQGVPGVPISFTLDGASAGTAVTDSSGVATLQGIATADMGGTHAGAVAASFAGDTDYTASGGVGNLLATAAATELSTSANASFGGGVTLIAKLSSLVTGQGIAGETVSFSLNGLSEGMAVTGSNGVATLSIAATSDAAGTYQGVVTAGFAGDISYMTSSATGNLVVSPAATSVASVSGSADYGGMATLTATLTSQVTGDSITGELMSFTLDGVTVGTAVSDGQGVATLTGVATSDLAGLHSGAVAVSFPGDTDYASGSGTGDLLVNQAATGFVSVSGSASFGGTATLTATLTSSVTGQGIAGETVSFVYEGWGVVGTAVTDANGLATLTGVATSDPPATYTGAIGVSFDGDANYTASSGSGDLVVSQAATSLSSVSGTATVDKSATLTATLTSLVTGEPVYGEWVNFELNGAIVGSALTDGKGVATLLFIRTSASVGTYVGAIQASYAGSSYYDSSTATGDLVIIPPPTIVWGVSGSATYGGTATLTAALLAQGTGLGIPGETVSFMLDGVLVGTAVTNSRGVAILTGVATSDSVGRHTGAVVVSFAGDDNYAASSGSGDLVVTN
ncbi:MAG: beta strand repeat-containing protein [Isosphaeraceae bacterium]